MGTSSNQVLNGKTLVPLGLVMALVGGGAGATWLGKPPAGPPPPSADSTQQSIDARLGRLEGQVAIIYDMLRERFAGEPNPRRR